jgi:hypothetical protein
VLAGTGFALIFGFRDGKLVFRGSRTIGSGCCQLSRERIMSDEAKGKIHKLEASTGTFATSGFEVNAQVITYPQKLLTLAQRVQSRQGQGFPRI